MRDDALGITLKKKNGIVWSKLEPFGILMVQRSSDRNNEQNIQGEHRKGD